MSSPRNPSPCLVGPSRTRTLDPLIKSRGAVTSRPSVFLLTSAKLPDQARSPNRVVHDTSAVSRHQDSRGHAPESIRSLKDPTLSSTTIMARWSPARKSEYEGGGGIPRACSSSGARESSRCSVERGDLGCHRSAVVQSATPAKGRTSSLVASRRADIRRNGP